MDFSSNFDKDIFMEEGATHSFEVLCPRCGVAKQGAGHWLYKPDRKCHLHCTACQRYPSARLWLCPCKVPWISCPDHRVLGFRCRGSDIVRDMTRPRKRNPPRDFWERSRKRLRPASGKQPLDMPHAPMHSELHSMHAPLVAHSMHAPPDTMSLHTDSHSMQPD